MIDHRLETFLTLCQTGNYTKTAEKLNMTQPAVSQQIQFLEDYYQVKLIAEKGKNFSLTEEGEAFRQYARTLHANSERILPLLQQIKNKAKELKFGATLTIGEYTVAPILAKIIKDDPDTNITMYVENTHLLQEMLWDGAIDFALLEGNFERNHFESKLLSNERFIAVCSPDNELAYKTNRLDKLLGENLIIREQGSGTRDILEQSLCSHNLNIKDFKRRTEIGNMNAIKKLCHKNLGITFMYQEAVKKEISKGLLKKISIKDFNINHPFNFVYMKDSPDKSQIEYWYERIISLRSN